MICIYRRAPSSGAVALAQAIRALGVRAKKVRRVRRGTVVGWGEVGPWLNGVQVGDKSAEIEIIRAAGVPTVETAVMPRDGYLPRSTYHRGGNDLLRPPARPDYWTKKEEIAREYRIHVFNGVSIRAGRKEPFKEDHHPWIRSRAGGWHLVYDGHGVRDKHRSVAKAAVAALGLTFGAVDVAERPDGTVFVLEVNRAPGLDNRTAEVYARKLVEYGQQRNVLPGIEQ